MIIRGDDIEPRRIKVELYLPTSITQCNSIRVHLWLYTEVDNCFFDYMKRGEIRVAGSARLG